LTYSTVCFETHLVYVPCRWPTTLNMAKFANAVVGTGVENWQAGGTSLGFSRYSGLAGTGGRELAGWRHFSWFLQVQWVDRDRGRELAGWRHFSGFLQVYNCLKTFGNSITGIGMWQTKHMGGGRKSAISATKHISSATSHKELEGRRCLFGILHVK